MNHQTIQTELERLANPAIADHCLKFFKTGPGQYGAGDRFYGIRVPVLRKLAKQHKTLPLKETRKLLCHPYHEARLLCLFILVLQYQNGDDSIQTQIHHLYIKQIEHINNWDLVDSSAEHIVGHFLRQKPKGMLYHFAKSQNLWKRRIAMMATFHYIKQNEFDTTLSIARILLNDSHDLIHKAVGWMLREIGNREQSVEEAFLKKHYSVMPRTMLRYAIEKFEEKKRQQYLQGKI